MTEFKQDTNETPVLFRVYRAPKSHGDDVTAVFPCEPAALHDYSMTCYAHVGQHGACSHGWYNKTRPAKPEEYADLQRELESAPYGYKLKIYRRMTSALRTKFLAERRRLLQR